MNTVQLECFLSVAEFLNFTRAAETVGMTQPAVSHQINTLEQELGTKLFVRTSKNVELTPAGAQFMNDAETILRIAATARGRLSDHTKPELIPLHIGCHNQMELSLLPKALNRLITRYPALHPSIKLLPFLSMSNLLEDETIQIMFGYKLQQQKKTIGIYQELAKCPIVCVCSENHPLASKERLTEEELKGSIILCTPHKMPAPLFHMLNRLSARRAASQIYFGDGYESLITLVRAGIGFTLVPDIPGMREPGCRYLPLENSEVLSFGVYYKTLKDQPLLRDFITILKETVQEAERV